MQKRILTKVLQILRVLPSAFDGASLSFMLADAEGTARYLYELAGFDYKDAQLPSTIAERIHGAGCLRVVPMRDRLAEVSWHGGRVRIAIASRVREPEWLIGHELAHLAERSVHARGGETEAYCDLVGACLLMPPAAFREALGAFGEDYAALAEHFGTTPTAVALRVGEVSGEGRVVVTPHRVLSRGQVQILEHQARILARDRGGPGVVAVDIGRNQRVLKAI
jgi:hypothetical protein